MEGDVVDAGNVLLTDKADHSLQLQGWGWVQNVNVAVRLTRQDEGSMELLGTEWQVVDVLRLSAALDK